MLQAFLELRALQGLFDKATEVLEHQLQASVCVSKCGRCCQVNTPMASIIEGINLVSVNMMDVEKVKRLVQTAEGWLLEPHGNTVFRGVPVGRQSGSIMEDWYRTARMQCPYLDDKLECVLHKDRPLTCRAFGVFRDAVEICPRPLGKGETANRHGIIDSGLVRPLVKDFYDSCKQRQPAWAIRSYLPTVIFRAASPKKFQEYIEDNKIASAKLLGMDIDTSLMWQPQLDKLRAGWSPDQVIQEEVIHGISA